jgi:hypothetical protein
MTNAHSEMGQMAVCCQNLPLGGLSSHSVPFVLVGALFKKFGLFFEHASYVEPKISRTKREVTKKTKLTYIEQHISQ